MNLEEYNKVKDLTYLKYCDYLQKKYGVGKCDYFTTNWSKKPKITRTSEGLFAHHKYEDHAIMLGNPKDARNNPYEWQLAENIVYCDWLEHLFLHVLICEYPSPNHNPLEAVGIGGAQNFIIPELNDLYSGMPIASKWRQICFDKIKDDEECYITLVNRLIEKSQDYMCFDYDKLFTSYNEEFGTWSSKKNEKITSKFKGINKALYQMQKKNK